MDMRLAQPDAPSASGEIVQTDQLGLRGQCVLRRTARFPGSAHFSSSALYLRCAGSRVDRPVVGPLYRRDRTVTPGTAGFVRFNPVANCARNCIRPLG